MAEYKILYWQDIPSVVEATDGETTYKAQLSQRFQDLIDSVAMRKNLVGTEGYMKEWRRGEATQRNGSAEAVVAAVTDELELQFDSIRRAELKKCKDA